MGGKMQRPANHGGEAANVGPRSPTMGRRFLLRSVGISAAALALAGSGATSGILTAKTTTSTSTFAVAEVEAVVTR